MAAIALAASLVLGAAGCGTPPRRLEFTGLAAPPASVAMIATPKPNEFQCETAQFRFDARTDRIRLVVTNRSAKEPLGIAWDRAFFIDPAGKKHAVLGYAEPRASLLRADPPAPLVVEPGVRWSGTVHPRDRIRPPGGSTFTTSPLLTGEEARPGAVVGLDLPLEIGRRSFYLEFRFKVTAAEVKD